MITQKTENPFIGAFKYNKDDERGLFRIDLMTGNEFWNWEPVEQL